MTLARIAVFIFSIILYIGGVGISTAVPLDKIGRISTIIGCLAWIVLIGLCVLIWTKQEPLYLRIGAFIFMSFLLPVVMGITSGLLTDWLRTGRFLTGFMILGGFAFVILFSMALLNKIGTDFKSLQSGQVPTVKASDTPQG